eukprot:m.820579 g.820579  ORF g.820579 m.820579 type:complete len:252 (+) comp59395_c0_seq33:5326-6081(+)
MPLSTRISSKGFRTSRLQLQQTTFCNTLKNDRLRLVFASQTDEHSPLGLAFELSGGCGVSFAPGTSLTMRGEHLSKFHKWGSFEHSQLVQYRNRVSGVTTPQQAALSRYTITRPREDKEKSSEEIANSWVLKFIMDNSLSFEIANSESFKSMIASIQKAGSAYKPPGSRKLLDLMEKEASTLKHAVVNELRSYEEISIAQRIRSDRNNWCGFIVCLQCKLMTHPHWMQHIYPPQSIESLSPSRNCLPSPSV